MEKFVILADDTSAASEAVNLLRGNGVEDTEISVLAREGTDLDSLPDANHEHASDIIPALKRGAGVGGTIGLLAGLGAMAFPPAGLVIGGSAVLGTAAGGATFGAWAASLIGVSVDNSQLREFESDVAEGKLLIVANVSDDLADDLTDRLARYRGIRCVKTLDAVPPVV